MELKYVDSKCCKLDFDLASNLRDLRFYAAPLLFGISVAACFVSEYFYPGHGVRFSMAFSCSGVLLLALTWRSSVWREMWRKSLPRTALVVLPFLGYASMIKPMAVDLPIGQIVGWVSSAIGIFTIGLGTLFIFALNASLASAAVTVTVVGSIVYKALIDNGFAPHFAVAGILIGAWGGVCSFGSAHVPLIARLSDVDERRIIYKNLFPATCGLVTGALCLVIEAVLFHGKQSSNSQSPRIYDLRAFLFPLLPLTVLLLKPLVDLLLRYVWNRKAMDFANYALIGSALCSIAALTFTTKPVSVDIKNFATGIGYGTLRVLFPVAAALVFVDALRTSGVERNVIKSVVRRRNNVHVLAMSSSWLLAAITGSSDPFVIAINSTLLPEARGLNLAPATLGRLTWLGGELGRCLSPAAAATLVVEDFAPSETLYQGIVFGILPIVFSTAAILFVTRRSSQWVVAQSKSTEAETAGAATVSKDA